MSLCFFVQFNILHLFISFTWNEISSVSGSAVCLAELSCYVISYTCMALHKFSKITPFIFIKMKNVWAALRRLCRVAINPWKWKWLRQQVNWYFAPRVLAGDTAWHTSSNAHLVIVSSVEFGCPGDWSKAYLVLRAQI